VGDWVLPILLLIVWAVGTPIIAIVALVKVSRVREQNEQLARQIFELRQRIGTAPAVSAAPIAAEPQPAVEAAPALPPSLEVPAPPVVESAVAETSPAPAVPPSAPLPPPFAAPPENVGLEQRLGARTFIWLGAITLALAGIFLVRYSIEEGYLSPPVRVVLAALFGFALIAGAEKVIARDARIAQAMAAAGVASLYGALLSAVALYELISKVAAGGGAAALTAFAIGVSLRHGIFVAGLAFIGGFASPAIIGSETPNTPVLFGYLLAIAAGTLAVIRHRGWWPLGWGVLAGSALWVAVWILSGADGKHFTVGFLVAIAGLFIWATQRRLAESENPPIDVAALIWSALAATGALIGLIVVVYGGAQTVGWVALAVHGVALYGFARWTPRFQYVAGLGPVLSLTTLGLWWLVTGGSGREWDGGHFAWVSTLFGLLYAAGAFALMWNAGRPGFWAALSVAAALTHFLLCWYVLRFTDTGTPWGLISIGLAAPFLVGAERLARWRETMPGATEALGFHAAGVTFFIAAAIPLELSRHWITVAYAIEFAAVAYIAMRLELWAMRQICWGLLAVVVVRFVLNPWLLDYTAGVTPIFNWILWSYGISIAALAVGRSYLRSTPDERLAQAVEAGIALLVFALLTLEVHSLFPPSTDLTNPSFMERAALVAVWGAFAVACLWMACLRLDRVLLWSWRLSGGLAAGVVLLVQVLMLNPIAQVADVGELPVLNGLLIAYAVPAALAGLARRWVDVENSEAARLMTGLTASVLAFVYVSFEVRHFYDPYFENGLHDIKDVELYTYSFVWLLFGVALLAIGFWREAPALRHAGMALVCIVVAKVFLIDMAGLQGLLRVLSFLGLGAALLGLGYAYRRFGFDQRQSQRQST
jgi:uncharacterized membrane protein